MDPQPAARTGDAVLLLLLAVAGCVDAFGLAELGNHFVSAMSGNTTEAGLAFAYRDLPGALLPLGLVALFVGGVTAGALAEERLGRRAPAILLFVEAALLLAAWALYRGTRPAMGTVLLPVAMGLANLVVSRRAGSRIGATFVTGTLVRIGVDLAALGRGGAAARLNRDLALWAAMVAGAFAGGWGRLGYGADVLLGPVAALALVAAGFAVRGR